MGFCNTYTSSVTSFLVVCPCSSILVLLLLASNLIAGEETCVQLNENPIRISRSLRTLQSVKEPEPCRDNCIDDPRCEAYRINFRGCEYCTNVFMVTDLSAILIRIMRKTIGNKPTNLW